MNKPTKNSMNSIKDILVSFNPVEDKYISREFQAYGYHLTEKLNDIKHKPLYMRLAKTLPRAVLEKALSYCMDADVPKKGALFMWKLKQLGAWETVKKVKPKKEKAVTDIPF